MFPGLFLRSLLPPVTVELKKMQVIRTTMGQQPKNGVWRVKMNQYLAKLTDKLLICKSKLNQSNKP
jgi:hypothetical protein